MIAVLVGSALGLLGVADTAAAAPTVRGYSWGLGTAGQLGNSATTTFTYPVQVTSTGALAGKTITSVTAGTNFACALAHAGAVASTRAYCWGEGSLGQLGNASSVDVPSPVAVAGPLAALQVSNIVAGDTHACAVTVTGAVYCWGQNDDGQLGQNSLTPATSNIPLPVTLGTLAGATATQVSAGTNFSCAITPTNAVTTQCWGRNTTGQIGDNVATTTDRLLATAVTGTVTGVTPSAIASGTGHTCVVSTVGSVQCWGLGTTGQLGNNATATSITSVTATGLPTTTNTITAGAIFTCASTSAGAGYCWGEGSAGQLGNDLALDTSSAVAVYTDGVLSGKSISRIKAGSLNTCAVTSDGGAYCWGAGTSGALGNKTTVQADIPVAVDTGTAGTGTGSFTDIALGTSFATSVFQSASVPGAPTSISVVAATASATVTFTAPTDTGGSAVTGYLVTSSGGQTCSPVLPALNCTVTGLANGTAYAFTAVATNLVGTGSASTASSPVTPFTTPNPPTGVTAVGGLDGMTPVGSQTVRVSWVAPVNTQGSAVTNYAVTSSPAGGTGCAAVAAPTLTCNVGSLSNGTPYAFTVTATNAAGSSISSGPSAPVTPATTPDPPTAVGRASGNRSIVVSWSAPEVDGGAAVTAYTATASPGGATCTAAFASCTIRGLANGITYKKVTVVATNSVGNSASSAPSGPVTPVAVAISLWGTITTTRKNGKNNVAKLYGVTARANSRVVVYRLSGPKWSTYAKVGRARSNSAGRWKANVIIGKANSARFRAFVKNTRSSTLVVARRSHSLRYVSIFLRQDEL